MDLLDQPSPSPLPPVGRQRQRRAGGRRAAQRRRARLRLPRTAGLRLPRPATGRREPGKREAGRRPQPIAATHGPVLYHQPVALRTRVARRRVLRAVAVLTAVALVVGGAVWLRTFVGDRTTSAPADGTAAAAAAAVEQTVLLLVRQAADAPVAEGLTLLAVGEDGSASATFIPSTTLVEIPGVGLDRLGLAQQYGGAPLTASTVENAIGIELDAVATVVPSGLGSLLQRAGGADIDNPERLVDRAADGTGSVTFDAGPQYLNGVRLAEYWAFEQRGESEIDTFPRQQRALDAFLRALDDEALRTSLLEDVPAELVTDAAPALLQPLFAGLADAAAADRLVYQLLPVAPFGSADDALGTSYQLRTEEVAALVAAQLSGARPEGDVRTLAIQVLNGVGVPGIGREVDERLQGLPVRIVRTENARSFDFPQTQVVVYDESPELLRAARQVRDALGVGTILVSRQPQSVVDMTVVVGGDLLGRGTPAPSGL